jgi:hypothetical protein
LLIIFVASQILQPIFGKSPDIFVGVILALAEYGCRCIFLTFMQYKT